MSSTPSANHAAVRADDESGSVGVTPSQYFDREVVVVAHPYRNRIEQMHEVEFAGGKSLDQRRPTADQRWRLDLETRVFEIPFGVRDQESGSIGDRQIADADHVIVRGAYRRQSTGG